MEALLVASPRARGMLSTLAEPLPEEVKARAVAAALPARRWPWAAGLALAAGLTVFLLLPPQVVAPDYQLSSVAGDLQSLRGPEARSRVFGPGSRLRLVVTPRTPRSDTPPIRLFVEARGVLRPAAAKTTPRDGAVRVEAEAADLFTEAGSYRLWLALGPLPETPPTRPDEARALEAVQWLTVAVEFRR